MNTRENFEAKKEALIIELVSQFMQTRQLPVGEITLNTSFAELGIAEVMLELYKFFDRQAIKPVFIIEKNPLSSLFKQSQSIFPKNIAEMIAGSIGIIS